MDVNSTEIRRDEGDLSHVFMLLCMVAPYVRMDLL